MDFEALYYADRLHIINRQGDVAVTTLWSRIPQFIKILAELHIDINPESSRIAVIGNLYGNGLPHMLRNLLWNPQIKHLIVVGHDLSGSKQDLFHFFNNGIYPDHFLGTPTYRIRETQRVMDGLVTPDHFKNNICFYWLGRFSEEQTRKDLITIFSQLPMPQPVATEVIERVAIPLPDIAVQRYPSDPRNHTVLRHTPLEAWQELIFRLVRFGFRQQLKKGERIELQNVKVIIENPIEESPQPLAEYGFSLDNLQQYQRAILRPDKPNDIEYTYGHRLRRYFSYKNEPVDSLARVIDHLREDPESRHAYIALWDTGRDLPEGHGCPCLVSLFFRRFEQRLTLTATFRTHNAMSAWLENVYGLIAIQRYVSEQVEMAMGAMTVISHSISIDASNPDVMAQAKAIAARKTTDDRIDPVTGKRQLRQDPNGNFTVTTDLETNEIVVQHNYDGFNIAEYRGRKVEELEQQLARDQALSEISHALYLGREMARAEMQLKKVSIPPPLL